MEFLSNFRQTSWNGMLKRAHKEKIYCPVGFSESFLQFSKRKSLKLAPMTKNQNFSIFNVFYAISVKIWTDSVVSNVENVYQGNN